jgi:cytosolic carboxypeptidase protein 6
MGPANSSADFIRIKYAEIQCSSAGTSLALAPEFPTITPRHTMHTRPAPLGSRSRASRFWPLLFLGLVLTARLHAEIKVTEPTQRSFAFEDSGIQFLSDFPGARLSDCTQTGDGEFRLLIRPENAPINHSPWYAFKVVSTKYRTITVRLSYENEGHRYSPKVSRNGVDWTPLGANFYARDREKKEAVLKLNVCPEPLWVSAQELITMKEFDAWMKTMTKRSYVKRSNVGESMLGKPIDQLAITQSTNLNYLFIIGRQHPPEVTGTLGLMAFTETIAGDSSLAKKFRRHFITIVIPLMNPDGVENGHWRHNMGGVDLNRDWRTFAQPETRLARDHFIRMASSTNARVYLMLDFHSTGEDIFYTQSNAEKTFPAGFTTNWLASIGKRFPDYKVVRSGSHDPRGGTSKVWGYLQFGAPCITYELGDNTDRKRIRQVVSGAAEEMMRLLLNAEKEAAAEKKNP